MAADEFRIGLCSWVDDVPSSFQEGNQNKEMFGIWKMMILIGDYRSSPKWDIHR